MTKLYSALLSTDFVFSLTVDLSSKNGEKNLNWHSKWKRMKKNIYDIQKWISRICTNCQYLCPFITLKFGGDKRNLTETDEKNIKIQRKQWLGKSIRYLTNWSNLICYLQLPSCFTRELRQIDEVNVKNSKGKRKFLELNIFIKSRFLSYLLTLGSWLVRKWENNFSNSCPVLDKSAKTWVAKCPAPSHAPG